MSKAQKKSVFSEIKEERGFESRPVRSNNVLKPSETTVFCVSDKSVQKTATGRTKFKHMICPYTEPEIKRYSNNDWCVEYWYQYPNDWPEFPSLKRFKVREGVNYIKDPEKKEEEITKLWRIVNIALKELNHNPFEDIIEKQRRIQEEQERQQRLCEQAAIKESELTIEKAFEWFTSTKTKSGLSDRTMEGYNSFMKNFKIWIDAYNENLSNKPYLLIQDLTTEVIEKYLEVSADAADWKGRTYNNNLKGLITIFGYLKKKKKIEVNPIGSGEIETRPNRSEKNKYYSKGTRDIIQPELDKIPYLDLFIKWVYYSCARITELNRLQVGDIDFELKRIRVPAEVGKTGAHVGVRTIPICEELHDLIDQMALRKLPTKYYIFTREQKPGLVMIADDYFRDIYLPIKRKLDLDNNYTLYSFKHTRVVDLLVAGYTPQLVMFLTGHTDWTSFQKYCRELGVVISDQLTGKTISY